MCARDFTQQQSTVCSVCVFHIMPFSFYPSTSSTLAAHLQHTTAQPVYMPILIHPFWLIPMRIRFGALDFGQVAKTNVVRASRNRLLARIPARRCCSGHLYVRVIQQVGFWTQKSQANVDYCYVWRRAKCTSLGPVDASIQTCADQLSLAAKTRAEALHVLFFATKLPNQAQ